MPAKQQSSASHNECVARGAGLPHLAVMKRFALRLLSVAMLGLWAASATAQVYPNIPPNTVLGRLGSGNPGQPQAIPFNILSRNLPFYAGQVNAGQFYVSTTGSDSNDCFAATGTGGHGPCLTIAHTVLVALQSAAGGVTQTINIGAGTWNESVIVAGAAYGSGSHQRVRLEFAGAGSGSTTWNGDSSQCGTLIAYSGADVLVDGITFKATAVSCQSELYADGGVIEVVSDVVFGAANGSQMTCEGLGRFAVNANYTISGSASTHIAAQSGCVWEINPNGYTITLTGTPAFSASFASAANNAVIYFGGPPTFSGSATGIRYDVSNNATITLDGTTSLTYLPGDTAGVESSNGRYIGPQVAGVSCSGSPTSSFASVGGVVTHC